MTFTDSEIEYMAELRLGRLATQQPDGTLQNNPVGYRYNPATQTIDIGGHGMATSRKFRNVEANRRAAFVIDDIFSRTPWRGRFLEIRGWAEALTDTDTGPAGLPGTGPDLIRVHPRRILSMGLGPDWDESNPTAISARDVVEPV